MASFTLTGAANISSVVFCTAFGPQVADANAGLISVEHCDGIWRGSFAPYRNASGAAGGNAEMQALMENEPRNFVIWGSVQSNGKFVATMDYTCMGPCIVSYPWPCASPTSDCSGLGDLCVTIFVDRKLQIFEIAVPCKLPRPT